MNEIFLLHTLLLHTARSTSKSPTYLLIIQEQYRIENLISLFDIFRLLVSSFRKSWQRTLNSQPIQPSTIITFKRRVFVVNIWYMLILILVFFWYWCKPIIKSRLFFTPKQELIERLLSTHHWPNRQSTKSCRASYVATVIVSQYLSHWQP